MVTLKEYEAYLKVKRFIKTNGETEIISKIMSNRNYVPLILELDGDDPVKCYSTSAAVRYCGGGVKEFRIKCYKNLTPRLNSLYI